MDLTLAFRGEGRWTAIFILVSPFKMRMGRDEISMDAGIKKSRLGSGIVFFQFADVFVSINSILPLAVQAASRDSYRCSRFLPPVSKRLLPAVPIHSYICRDH